MYLNNKNGIKSFLLEPKRLSYSISRYILKLMGKQTYVIDDTYAILSKQITYLFCNIFMLYSTHFFFQTSQNTYWLMQLTRDLWISGFNSCTGYISLSWISNSLQPAFSQHLFFSNLVTYTLINVINLRSLVFRVRLLYWIHFSLSDIKFLSSNTFLTTFFIQHLYVFKPYKIYYTN